MNIKHTIALAAASLLATVMPAQAGVVAMADLSITGLGIFVAGGTTAFTDLTILSESRTGTASSSYNGSAPNGINLGSVVVGATVDVPFRCAGDCAGAAGAYAPGGGMENNVTDHLTTSVANYALGDMKISGSAFGTSSTASGLTRANAAAVGPTNTGSANAVIQNDLTAKTTFTVGSTKSVYVGASWDVFVKSFVDGLGAGASGKATANTKWNLVLTDDTAGVDVLDWTPASLKKSFTSTGDFNKEFSEIGGGFTGNFDLIGGHFYSVVIAQSSSAIVSAIPEPGSLALVGLALFGLGAVRRRSAK